MSKFDIARVIKNLHETEYFLGAGLKQPVITRVLSERVPNNLGLRETRSEVLCSSYVSLKSIFEYSLRLFETDFSKSG